MLDANKDMVLKIEGPMCICPMCDVDFEVCIFTALGRCTVNRGGVSINVTL